MEGFFWEFLSSWSYLGLLLVLLAAGFGLPIPEDIPLILAGLLVQKSADLDLTLMICTGLAGVMLGDSALFFLGRRYGPGILDHRWFRRFAKPWLVESAREKYKSHGAKILFAARFMPGLRAVLFLTAGVFKVPYWKMLAFDGTAALISVPVWVWAGWFFSEKIGAVFDSARVASIVIGSIAAASLVSWVIYQYYRNRKRKERAPDLVGESSSGILEEASASLVTKKEDAEALNESDPNAKTDAKTPGSPTSRVASSG